MLNGFEKRSLLWPFFQNFFNLVFNVGQLEMVVRKFQTYRWKDIDRYKNVRVKISSCENYLILWGLQTRSFSKLPPKSKTIQLFHELCYAFSHKSLKMTFGCWETFYYISKHMRLTPGVNITPLEGLNA